MWWPAFYAIYVLCLISCALATPLRQGSVRSISLPLTLSNNESSSDIFDQPGSCAISPPAPIVSRTDREVGGDLISFVDLGIRELRGLVADFFTHAQLYEVQLLCGAQKFGTTASDFSEVTLIFRWYNAGSHVDEELIFDSDVTSRRGPWSNAPEFSPWTDFSHEDYRLGPFGWAVMCPPLQRDKMGLARAMDLVRESPDARVTMRIPEEGWDFIRLVRFTHPKPDLRNEVVYEFPGTAFVGTKSGRVIPYI